jgi:hypothetical protein
LKKLRLALDILSWSLLNFMQELVQKLEIAVLRRNPLLAKKLQPGLPVGKIKKDLKRSGIEGAIDPIVELYSWRNGTALDMDLSSSKIGFVPESVYQFTELRRAIVDMKSFKELAHYHPRLSVLVGRYFPFLWDGSDRWIALDIESCGHSRVVMIQDQEEEPLREAYDSFEDFLTDAIRANENNEPLACIRKPGKPITDISQNRPEPAGKSISASKVRAKKKKLPLTENTLVLRTDFSDESTWKSLCTAIQDPDEEFGLSLDFVSDPAYDGLTADQLPSLLPEDSSAPFAFIIDRIALSHPDYPILVIDLHDKPGRTFRVVPSALGDVANNLSIANMGFDEFADAADQEGVFRGFQGK